METRLLAIVDRFPELQEDWVKRGKELAKLRGDYSQLEYGKKQLQAENDQLRLENSELLQRYQSFFGDVLAENQALKGANCSGPSLSMNVQAPQIGAINAVLYAQRAAQSSASMSSSDSEMTRKDHAPSRTAVKRLQGGKGPNSSIHQ